MSPSPVTTWLLTGAATVLALQLLLVGVLVLRGAWAGLRVNRWRQRSRVLDELLEDIEKEPSIHVRRELLDKRLGRDLHALESWLDVIVERGEDPARLSCEVYEDAGLVEHYVETLAREGRWTRRAVAAAILGWTQSPRAVEPLLACVQDVRREMPAVRAVALRALGRLRHPDAVDPLIEALASEETWLPPAVATMLARIGSPALTPLARKLANPDETEAVRRWGAQVLGDIGDRRALPVLLDTLNDVDAELRARAAHALGSIGDERAVDPLLERLLVDPVPFVRIAVAKSLGIVGTEHAMQRLVEALADPEWWVRLRAVEALQHIGSSARDLLVATLSDPDPQVKRETARALEGIGVISESLETIRAEGYVPAVAELLVEIGRAGNIEPLLDELGSENEDHLRVLVRILARVRDARAGRELANLLDRAKSTGLRARVIDALRRIGDATHVERIAMMLKDPDEWVRKASVDYVAAYGDADVIGSILPLVDDPNPWTRESALHVLERLAPDVGALPILIARIEDPHDFVRAQAVRTLCSMGAFDALVMSGVLESIAEVSIRNALLAGLARAATPDALVLIRGLAAFVSDQDLDRLRTVAKVALSALDSEAIDALIEDGCADGKAPSNRWLAAVAWSRASEEIRSRSRDTLSGDDDPRVRAALLSAMADRPHEELDADFETLVDLASDDEAPLVLRAAVHAAVRLDARWLVPHLRRLADHDDPQLQIDAMLAIRLLSSRSQVLATREWILDDRAEVRVARTVGGLARGRTDVVLTWLGLLDDRNAIAVFEDWIERAHPLILHILAKTASDDELTSRLLHCRSSFEAEQLLVEELESSSESKVRLLALEGIAAIGSERGTGRVLAAFLKDHAPAVRSRALRELVTKNAFGRGRQFLTQAFEDPEDALQIAAAQLCANLPPDEAIVLLAGQLVTRRPAVLRAITDILAGIAEDEPEQVIEVILGLPAQRERMVGLVLTLEKSLSPISEDVLEVLLTHRWAAVRAEALRALLPHLADEAFAAIRRGANDPAATVREMAVNALTDPRVPSLRHDFDPVKELLEDRLTDPSPQVRSRVALSLGSLEFEGRVRMLTVLRKDPNARVARVARRIDERRKAARESTLHEAQELPS